MEVVDVQIGQVRAAKGQAILQSKALGSCIAVVAFDPHQKAGVMAHIMLPGAAPAGKSADEKTRYAADAIAALLEQVEELGSKKEDVCVSLVGAANVLRRDDDTICRDNIKSVLGILAEKGLRVKGRVIGGTCRRNVFLDVERGTVSYIEGNGRLRHLCGASG